MIISDDHRLELASRYANFDGITDCRGPDQGYTALLPAAGWRVEFTDDDSKWSEPLVGWALKDGNIVPLSTDSSGLVEDFEGLGGEWRIYHPDSTKPAPEEAAP